MEICLNDIWEKVFRKIQAVFGRIAVVGTDGRRVDSIDTRQGRNRVRLRAMLTDFTYIETESVDSKAAELLKGVIGRNQGAAAALEKVLQGLLATELQEQQKHLEQLFEASFSDALYPVARQQALQTLGEAVSGFAPLLAEYGVGAAALTAENALKNLTVLTAAAAARVDVTGLSEASCAALQRLQADVEKAVSGYVRRQTMGVGRAQDAVTHSYLQKLWQEFRKPRTRDGDNTRLRELTEIYVFPRFEKTAGVPFAGSGLRRLVLAGSGIGKTMLLQVMTLVCAVRGLPEADIPPAVRQRCAQLYEKLFGADAPDWLPVHIRAQRANSTRCEALTELAYFADDPHFAQAVETAHAAGRLLVLIDGIDELDERAARAFFAAMERLCAALPGSSIVVSSRFHGKIRALQGFEQTVLSGFDLQAIRELTDRMLAQPEEVKQAIQEKKYWAEIASNPYMLSKMLENVAASTVKSCSVRHFLDGIVNDIIDRRWDKLELLPETADIRLILGFTAWKMMSLPEKRIPRAELAAVFAQAWEQLAGEAYGMTAESVSPAAFARTVAAQSGILNLIVENSNEYFVFQDRLVMWFLAAEFFARTWERSLRQLRAESLLSLERFVEEYTEGGALCRDKVCALVIAVSMRNQASQQAILRYLLCRGVTAEDEEQRSAVAEGLEDLQKQSFGLNQITNPLRSGQPSPDSLLIERYLHNG